MDDATVNVIAHHVLAVSVSCRKHARRYVRTSGQITRAKMLVGGERGYVLRSYAPTTIAAAIMPATCPTDNSISSKRLCSQLPLFPEQMYSGLERRASGSEYRLFLLIFMQATTPNVYRKWSAPFLELIRILVLTRRRLYWLMVQGNGEQSGTGSQLYPEQH